jgi:hypothetical protein
MTRDQYLAAHLRRIRAEIALQDESLIFNVTREQYLREQRERINSEVPQCPNSQRTGPITITCSNCDDCGFRLYS